MIRLIITAVMMFALCATSSRADGEDPYTYKMQRAWNGYYACSPADSSIGIFISPASLWTQEQSKLLAVSGSTSRSVENGAGTVVGASYWGNNVLVLQEHLGVVSATLYNATCTKQLFSSITLPDVAVDDHMGMFIVNIHTAHLGNIVYVHIGHWLYRLQKTAGVLQATLVDDRVMKVQSGWYDNRWELCYLHSVGYSMFVSIVDSTSTVVSATMVPSSTSSKLLRVQNTIAVISDLDGASSTVVSLLDRNTQALRSRSLNAPASCISLAEHAGSVALVSLTTRSGKPELVVIPAFEQYEELPPGDVISGDFGSPRFMSLQHDTAYIVFSGGLVVMTLDGSILARDVMTVHPETHEVTAHNNGQVLIMRSPRGTAVYSRGQHSAWYLVRAYDAILRYVLPLLFLGSLAFVWMLNRRQRRTLDAIIDSPATGLVFSIDASGKLMRVNERAAKLLRITPNVPMGRHFRAYMQHSGLEQLALQLDSLSQARPDDNRRVTIQMGEELREYIFASTPLVGLFGSARGSIITGVDITETLEQRRLVNWAQLAHDMQTNLSTIRLNAEQLPADDQSNAAERKRRILFQVGVLIDRVRDLLSIGRTDELQRLPVHSAELCTEIRHEFDADMFPHVRFSMKLRGTMMNVDRMKVARAVRNAVENAIKALRGQQGTVEISTWHDRLHVFISVSDTGVGMDPETMSNMMKPYFSTAHDGSGHGIGTMIMHHVMKLHGGAIRVTSEPGKGTQVIFRIPHEMDPKDVVRMATSERSS